MSIKITANTLPTQARIDYTNYRGERATRLIEPKEIVWGSTSLHTTEQWLLVAHDIEKGKERTFTMSTIHSWENTDIVAEIDETE